MLIILLDSEDGWVMILVCMDVVLFGNSLIFVDVLVKVGLCYDDCSKVFFLISLVVDVVEFLVFFRDV